VLDGRDLYQRGFADFAGFPVGPRPRLPRLERAGQDAVDLPDCRAGLATAVIVTMRSRRSWK
jgi:hypothetical protein